MSTDLELESGNRTFTKMIVPLLQEYAERLRVAIHAVMLRADEISKLDESGTRRRAIADELLRIERNRLGHMMPGIQRLIRQTSQQLEHGAVDDISRIFLEVHLAELEGMVQTAQDAEFFEIPK